MGFKKIRIGVELKHEKYGWIKRIECPHTFKPDGEDLDKYFWYCNCDVNEVLDLEDIEKFDMEYIKYKNELYKITSTGVYIKVPISIDEQTIDIEEEFNAGEYVHVSYKPIHHTNPINFNQLTKATNSKETKMNTNTITTTKRTKASIANTLKDTNLSAVKIATRITLGKTINKALAKKVKPKLPMMIRGYAEHPLFDILLANAFNIIVKQKFPENKKANYAADAMMEASMLTMAESFNLDEMLSDFLDGIKLPD